MVADARRPAFSIQIFLIPSVDDHHFPHGMRKFCLESGFSCCVCNYAAGTIFDFGIQIPRLFLDRLSDLGTLGLNKLRHLIMEENALSFVCEIAVSGDESQGEAVAAWLSGTVQPKLTTLAGLLSADAYTPAAETARDPYNDKEAPPLLILIADFSSEAALREALAGAALLEALGAHPKGTKLTVSAFRRAFYPPDENGAMPAPVSYVVRYQRPAEDEAAFVENYTASHPPIQAGLPGIRSIMCYFPLHGLTASGWPSVDYLVGNEVAFDSVDAFNAAMQSPAREELRVHFREFPPYSGINSHFLMQRRRLVSTPAGG